MNNAVFHFIFDFYIKNEVNFKKHAALFLKEHPSVISILFTSMKLIKGGRNNILKHGIKRYYNKFFSN